MKIPVVISLLICLMSEAFGGPNYCDPDLCGEGETHVGCGSIGFADSCPDNVRYLDVDPDVVVKAHNDVRQKWASGKGKVRVEACRMATVSWDDELAKLAEYNLQQCQMEHDECHNTYKFKSSGQNLFYKSLKGGNAPEVRDILEEAIADWESEGRFVDAKILAAYPENYNGPVIGHFTMLAQELNVAVGCAASNFQTDNGYNTYLVACNYGRSTIPNTPVYRGCKKAAIECESGTNPDYPALCSLKEKVKFN
ncbi:antigen 5 like allergen Cul n 1 isoform X2 [Drosophila innubila]|uniref:antigen 5 like allergen Cul n 1 isoform X2 n=1 Tax=Drosophila innubila TaxID=198719 RepID=UPI00148CB543|nr:antigen 5 like allergen Cul n 1 isoform X2 [Drosophila innubila]